jgi:diguanylate cyclase (GGDEF)-like protein/putative nucleotidyltransferase with HDIG domain
MKLFENKRSTYINRYITLSQVVFFLLIGILLFRVTHISFETVFLKLNIIFLFMLGLAMIPLIQTLNIKFPNYEIICDFFIISVYIIVSIMFLIKEQGELSKIVLLMPVIIMALKYGVSMAYLAAGFSTVSLFVVGVFSGFNSADFDIMYIGIFLLLAWLLGNMTETEHNIRKELERLATHDGLTDIYNHRSFQNILDLELEKAKNENNKVSLILLDIDYFKFYNDAYGHQEGDKVLQKLAQLLTDTVGNKGYCARYGGEEFAVILPGFNINEAKEVGEQIREVFESYKFPGTNVFPDGKLTASIGVAEYPLNADTKEKLIKKTDEALYRAKFVSKNRVESYYSVFDELSLFLKEDEKELFNSISAFTMVINAKDSYTYGHSLRVMELAKNLSLRMDLNNDLIQEISFGALLHDIGKIEISREILNKPNKLNSLEWDIFRQHPIWGAEIIAPLKSLKGVKEIILYHHENYDGTGYPEGISGNNIPIGAKILRIVDSYDAMTTDRPYKVAFSLDQALEELDRYSGSHYDPYILAEFKIMMRELQMVGIK